MNSQESGLCSTHERSPNSRRMALRILKSAHRRRRVIAERKRRQAEQMELIRLQNTIPSLAGRDGVSEQTVLEEASILIDRLHGELSKRLYASGQFFPAEREVPRSPALDYSFCQQDRLVPSSSASPTQLASFYASSLQMFVSNPLLNKLTALPPS